MLTMTVEYSEARAHMHEVVDAVEQGREVTVTYFGEPLATLVMHGPRDEAPPPREWIEAVVREGFDELAQKMSSYGILPSAAMH